MKNSNNEGFDQHYNAQAAVEQDSFLIVAHTLSNHPNDQAEAIPTLDAIPSALGKPKAGALDNGYFSATNIAAMETRDIEPYIATGRTPHHPSGRRILHNSRHDHQRMPVRRYTWLTNSRLRLAAPSTACKMYRRTGVGHYQRYLGFSPILAAWLVGRRGGMVSRVSGIQLEASAYFDHGISVPTIPIMNGTKSTILHSGTQWADTPHAPRGARMRSGGLPRHMVDSGRVSQRYSAP